MPEPLSVTPLGNVLLWQAVAGVTDVARVAQGADFAAAVIPLVSGHLSVSPTPA